MNAAEMYDLTIATFAGDSVPTVEAKRFNTLDECIQARNEISTELYHEMGFEVDQGRSTKASALILKKVFQDSTVGFESVAFPVEIHLVMRRLLMR